MVEAFFGDFGDPDFVVLTAVGDEKMIFGGDETAGKDDAEGLPGGMGGTVIEVLTDDRALAYVSDGEGRCGFKGVGAHKVVHHFLIVRLLRGPLA